MLVLLTCEGPHAPDLGYLLHKNPASLHEREIGHGKLTVFYTENEPARATVALLVEIDPIALARGEGRAASLEQYVNDRPYVASSFTSVALRDAFSTALSGRSKERPELVSKPLPLRARIPAIAVASGVSLIERLFAPLGYEVRATAHPLDAAFPSWRGTGAISFEISGEKTVQEILTHLYVLLPVLDDDKHYFVGDDEVRKLVDHGEGWLAAHPEKELIARRYLAYQRPLVTAALSQLTVGQEEKDEEAQAQEDVLEEKVRLSDQRLEAVLAALREGAPPIKRIVDMGCGEGRLLRLLVEERAFEEIAGVDVSSLSLERAEKRLHLDRRPQAVRERVKLLQGSLLYDDKRLHGWDALALVEVIEHIDADRLDVVRKVVFERLRPRRVVLTTPNAEFNVRFETLPAGKLRHADHRFEWTRAELREWCAGARGYRARFVDVGPSDPEVGSPTQMAILDRESET
ncbi:3' terminal RNA ribose 2'-O-methyltransferase Hen1 [bacterium]|nr:3' terminal RNA ribose 2'-O-methyltransferase Hen1 [bacterium]